MSKALIKPSLAERYPAKQTLTQLASEAIELVHIIMKNGGEITPEIEERLEVNSKSIMSKVDGYVAIEDQFQAQADLCRSKANVWSKVAKTFEGRIEKLRSNIKFCMKEMEKDEILGKENRYVLSKSVPKLVIDSEDEIPNEFKMIVQKTELDKEKIKQALINGFEVPGAHIEENGTLRVYETSGKD